MRRCGKQLAGKRPPHAENVELQSVTGEKIVGDYTFVRELRSAA